MGEAYSRDCDHLTPGEQSAGDFSGRLAALKLYKFKSLARFDRVLDIVLNERLHCAEYRNLNDPFEGIFVGIVPRAEAPPQSRGGLLYATSVEQLPQEIKNQRVCSLASSTKEVRLWSHYADGHRGVAIEVDFAGLEGDLHKVEYVDRLPHIFQRQLDRNVTAEEVLTSKTLHWSYETEYRILHDQEHFDIRGCVSAILLGHRIDPTQHELLKKSLISANVPLVGTHLDTNSMTVVDPRWSRQISGA